MFRQNLLYTKNRQDGIICIAAEIRHLIQNWRKKNNLPIDFRVPTLKVWYDDEHCIAESAITTALIEGQTEANNKTHLFELCQVDNVEFDLLKNYRTCYDTTRKDDKLVLDELHGIRHHDFYFWSPLGGTLGYGNVLDDTRGDIKKMTKIGAYNQYVV